MVQLAGMMQEGEGNGVDWLNADGTYASILIYPDYHRRIGGRYGRHGMTFERLPIEPGMQVCVKDDPDAPVPGVKPYNINVPYAWQDADTLSCTMGEWTGEPDAYAYQWQLDGADIATGASYVVTPDDVGKTAVCVVTASNAVGSTDAPPSNAVMVTAPVIGLAAEADPPPVDPPQDDPLRLRIPEPPEPADPPPEVVEEDASLRLRIPEPPEPPAPHKPRRR